MRHVNAIGGKLEPHVLESAGFKMFPSSTAASNASTSATSWCSHTHERISGLLFTRNPRRINLIRGRYYKGEGQVEPIKLKFRPPFHPTPTSPNPTPFPHLPPPLSDTIGDTFMNPVNISISFGVLMNSLSMFHSSNSSERVSTSSIRFSTCNRRPDRKLRASTSSRDSPDRQEEE